MKEVKKIAEGKNFSAVDFGKLNELGDYVLFFRFTLLVRRVVSITRIKPTRNSISFSAAKENIRLTA